MKEQSDHALLANIQQAVQALQSLVIKARFLKALLELIPLGSSWP